MAEPSIENLLELTKEYRARKAQLKADVEAYKSANPVLGPEVPPPQLSGKQLPLTPMSVRGKWLGEGVERPIIPEIGERDNSWLTLPERAVKRGYDWFFNEPTARQHPTDDRQLSRFESLPMLGPSAMGAAIPNVPVPDERNVAHPLGQLGLDTVRTGAQILNRGVLPLVRDNLNPGIALSSIKALNTPKAAAAMTAAFGPLAVQGAKEATYQAFSDPEMPTQERVVTMGAGLVPLALAGAGAKQGVWGTKADPGVLKRMSADPVDVADVTRANAAKNLEARVRAYRADLKSRADKHNAYVDPDLPVTVDPGGELKLQTGRQSTFNRSMGSLASTLNEQSLAKAFGYTPEQAKVQLQLMNEMGMTGEDFAAIVEYGRPGKDALKQKAADPWEAVYSKAAEKGIKINRLDPVTGQKTSTPLPGDAAVLVVKKQRGLQNQLKSLIDCLNS